MSIICVMCTSAWFQVCSQITATALNAASGEDFKNISAAISSIATAVAVVAGGLWAYFKFFRGRTYRPRLAVHMMAQWRLVNDRHLLHARITVKNIGVSVVVLRQDAGTGLRVSVLAPDQPEPPTAVEWDVVRVFEILKDHEWIEAGETVSDDVLLDIDIGEPAVILFEARLVWRQSGHKKEIVVMARQVFSPDTTLKEAPLSVPDGDA